MYGSAQPHNMQNMQQQAAMIPSGMMASVGAAGANPVQAQVQGNFFQQQGMGQQGMGQQGMGQQGMGQQAELADARHASHLEEEAPEQAEEAKPKALPSWLMEDIRKAWQGGEHKGLHGQRDLQQKGAFSMCSVTIHGCSHECIPCTRGCSRYSVVYPRVLPLCVHWALIGRNRQRRRKGRRRRQPRKRQSHHGPHIWPLPTVKAAQHASHSIQCGMARATLHIVCSGQVYGTCHPAHGE